MTVASESSEGDQVNAHKEKIEMDSQKFATHPYNDAKTIHIAAVGIKRLEVFLDLFCSLFENFGCPPTASSHPHAFHL